MDPYAFDRVIGGKSAGIAFNLTLLPTTGAGLELPPLKTRPKGAFLVELDGLHYSTHPGPAIADRTDPLRTASPNSDTQEFPMDRMVRPN